MPTWQLGCIGYSYRDWCGPFFPDRLPSSEWLSVYARTFSVVELNTTFHALPTAETVSRWADSVPDGFRFGVKAWRAITHDSPLDEAAGPLMAFLQRMDLLGEHLGPMVLQFPPDLTIERQPAVDRLLRQVPLKYRCAIELRSPTWRHREVSAWLRELNIAWVGSELESPAGCPFVLVTSDLVYVRLVGRHNRFETSDYERFDPTDLLTQWKQRFDDAKLGGVKEIWVMVGNDLVGHAPATLRRFANLMNLSLSPGPMRQRDLF